MIELEKYNLEFKKIKKIKKPILIFLEDIKL